MFNGKQGQPLPAVLAGGTYKKKKWLEARRTLQHVAPST
jgi:hypothetical protein